MKTLSKAVLIALIGTLLMPAMVSAREAETRPPRVEVGAFCLRFTDATGKLGTDTTARFNDLTGKFQQRGEKINKDFTGISEKIAQNRQTADKKRDENLVKLEAKATTPSQKAAVEVYKTSIMQAATQRRATVDAANAAYKQGLLQANTARQNQLKSSATAYKSAVSAALTQAKASCSAGATAQAVRTSLQAALDVARTSLENARKTATQAGPSLDPLKATRQAAVAKADADFKATVKAALETFKNALKTANTSN